MEVRLCVIPNAETSAKVGRLGKKYGSRQPHYFLVDNRKLFPHVTLFKVDIPKNDYLKLLAAVKTAVSQSYAFTARIRRFGLAQAGWLDLELERSQRLERLRRNLASAINETGIAMVGLGKRYRPHLTLARFYNDRAARQSVKGEPQPKLGWTAAKVGLCLSRNTQVYKIINYCKLK